MRKEINDNKGITIIGLVVTIIVLLILAGVTIVALTGQHSIIKEANDAKNATNKAAAQEEIELATVRALKNNITDMNGMKQYLSTNLKKSQVSTNGKGEVTVSYKDYDFVIDEEWNVKENTLLAKIDASNYGDVINYGIDLSTIEEDANRIKGWKIFYRNNEGTFIISSDYVHVWNDTVSKARTKAKVSSYGWYGVNWPDASYLTKKDASGNAIIDSNASKFMYNWTGGGMTQPNKIAIASLLDTNAWSDFVTDGATMAIGSPTLEMFRASWNEKTYSSGTHTKLQISQDTTNGYGYYVGASNEDNATITSDHVSMSSDAGYQDKLYYPHPSNSVGFNNCNAYWLASPSVRGNYGVLYVSRGGSVYYGNYSDSDRGVRPVVFLPSNVKAYQDSNGVWQIEK